MSLPDTPKTGKAQIKENAKRYAASPLDPKRFKGTRFGGGSETQRMPVAPSGGGKHAKPLHESDLVFDKWRSEDGKSTRSNYAPKHAAPTAPVDRAGDTSRRPGM